MCRPNNIITKNYDRCEFLRGILFGRCWRSHCANLYEFFALIYVSHDHKWALLLPERGAVNLIVRHYFDSRIARVIFLFWSSAKMTKQEMLSQRIKKAKFRPRAFFCIALIVFEENEDEESAIILIKRRRPRVLAARMWTSTLRCNNMAWIIA